MPTLLNLRQRISKPIFNILKKTLPAMSQTESEALKAGNTWWDAELFSGQPDWSKLQHLPVATLTEEEQSFLNHDVETLCGLLNNWDITHHRYDFPPEVWQFIKEHKFGGMTIPKEYGGLGFSHYAYPEIVMKLYSRCSSVAISVMIPNSGSAKLVLANGTETQKKYYLPRFSNGEDLPAFALSGTQAGSDAGAMPDTGVVCYGDYHGETVLGIRLNWEKRYISFSPLATVLAMTFKLYDPDHLLSEKVDRGVTIALVPTDTQGVTIGQRHFVLDAGLQNGPNWGNDVFIPLDNIIGGAAQIGNGWKMLMQSLAVGRAISLPALSAGAAKFACRYTGAYARVRKQFNRSIGEFEGVAEVLARMAGETYILEASRCVTAAVLQGHHSSVIAAIVKYQATEKARQIINDAMDIQGGSGICLGEKNYIAHLYQVTPIGITVEGANILTRSMMIFGQGAVRCHPFIQQEMLALGNPSNEQGLIEFDAVFWKHICLVFKNLISVFSASWLCSTGDENTKRYYQFLSRFSACFALVSDYALLTLGGSLKQKERISGLFADVLSQLYLCSTVLKHYENQGSQADDKALLDWAAQHCLYQAQTALNAVFSLLPVPALVWLLKRVIFPFGLTLTPPKDELIEPLAKILMSDCEARNRLTQGIYINQSDEDVSGRMDMALQAVLAAAPVEARLNKARRQKQLPKSSSLEQQLNAALAKNIITGAEANIVKTADEARNKAISVDVFVGADLSALRE